MTLWFGPVADVARRIAQREGRGQGKGRRVEELTGYADRRIRYANVLPHPVRTFRRRRR